MSAAPQHPVQLCSVGLLEEVTRHPAVSGNYGGSFLDLLHTQELEGGGDEKEGEGKVLLGWGSRGVGRGRVVTGVQQL